MAYTAVTTHIWPNLSTPPLPHRGAGIDQTRQVIARYLVVGILLTGAGCDVVFGLEARQGADAGTDGAAPYERCGPLLYDDALRYAPIANPSDQLWSWDDARVMCKQLGMDLAVFNDVHELGMASTGLSWPYWFGETMLDATVSTVDQCPAFMPLTTGFYLAPAGTRSCGIVSTANELESVDCTGQLPAAFDLPRVNNALCETPRPEDKPCLGRDPKTERYVSSPGPQTFAAARAFCSAQHGHLVVFESSAEWTHVSDLISGNVTPEAGQAIAHNFWLGSTYDGAAWSTENGCPAVYSWTENWPDLSAGGACAAGVLRTAADPTLPVTYLAGAAVTACDDGSTYALCEIEP
jgi:hypothetical protein